MKKFYFFAYFILSTFLAEAAITVTVTTPTQYQVVKADFPIKVSVQSTYEVDSVIVYYKNRQKGLAYNLATGYFEGTLSVQGFNDGDTVDLNVVARDVFNNAANTVRKVVYDIPPVVYFDYPIANSVFRGSPVLFKARCLEPDSCTYTLSFGTRIGAASPSNSSTIIKSGKFKDSVIATFTIPTSYYWANGGYYVNTEAMEGQIILKVTDKQGQSKTISKAFDTQNSNRLIDFFSSDSLIMDFNYNKVLGCPSLFRGLSNNFRLPLEYSYVYDLTTKTNMPIPLKLSFIDYGLSGQLMDGGAVFVGQDSLKYTPDVMMYTSNYENEYMYTWQGTKTDSFPGKVYRYKVAGNYAVWVDTTTTVAKLYRRDLLSGTTLLIDPAAYITSNWKNGAFQVFKDGSVFFVKRSNTFPNENFELISFKNGIYTTILSKVSNGFDGSFVTDGEYIVYLTYNGSNYSEVLFDGTSHIPLNSLANSFYLVVPKNKYVAYYKQGTTGQRQIWLRDPLGNHKQVTFFTTNSFVVSLNEKGDILYETTTSSTPSRQNYYLALNNGPTIYLTKGNLGTPYYRDSTWYTAIGRELFKIDVTPPLPVKLISFTCTKNREKNDLAWTTAGEINFAFFEIETSKDGSDFSTLGNVNALGNNSKYSFSHYDPPKAINYYRLRMVDKDGNYEYSQVRRVNNSNAYEVSIYPNPANDKVVVEVNAEKKMEALVTILDLAGRRYLTRSVRLEQGVNTLPVEISTLASGSYLLQVNVNGKEPTLLKFQKL